MASNESEIQSDNGMALLSHAKPALNMPLFGIRAIKGGFLFVIILFSSTSIAIELICVLILRNAWQISISIGLQISNSFVYSIMSIIIFVQFNALKLTVSLSLLFFIFIYSFYSVSHVLKGNQWNPIH